MDLSYHFKDKWQYWSTMQIFVSAVFNAPIKRASSRVLADLNQTSRIMDLAGDEKV